MTKFWKRKPDRVCSELDLRALEQYSDDYDYRDRNNGHSIARIDPDDMDALRVLQGDWIKIMGGEGQLKSFDVVFRHRTVVKCLPLHVAPYGKSRDKGKNIIRTDKLTRMNAKFELGDTVTIRKEKPLIAEHVALAPVEDQSYPFDSVDLRTIAEFSHGMPICTGNIIFLRHPQFPLTPFHVLSYTCNGEAFLLENSRSALIIAGTTVLAILDPKFRKGKED